MNQAAQSRVTCARSGPGSCHLGRADSCGRWRERDESEVSARSDGPSRPGLPRRVGLRAAAPERHIRGQGQPVRSYTSAGRRRSAACEGYARSSARTVAALSCSPGVSATADPARAAGRSLPSPSCCRSASPAPGTAKEMPSPHTTKGNQAMSDHYAQAERSPSETGVTTESIGA